MRVFMTNLHASLHTSENPKISLPPSTPLSTLLAIGGFVLGGTPERKAVNILNKKSGALLMMGDVVLVTDPAMVRSIFSASPSSLISGRFNAVLDFLYGQTSMFLVDGAPHHRLRRLLVPPFRNKDSLASYVKIIERVAEDVLDDMPIDSPFALLPELRHGMLEIILRIIFGISDEARLAPFRVAMTDLLEISTSYSVSIRYALRNVISFRHWGRLQAALKASNTLIYSEISRRRDDPLTQEQDDILALLLRTRTEEGELLSDVEIRDQLVTMLIAGHETTATTLAWAFERLLRTPNALARLSAEAQTNDHEYADAVVTETLRLRPPIPAFSREVAGEFSLGGYNLPKGTLLLAHVAYIHHRADLFENPHDFCPERFLDRKSELGAYIPFGGGLHSCIGNHFAALEVRISLHVMLRRGLFVADRKASEREHRLAILNLPARGARVTLLSRKQRQPMKLVATKGCPMHK
jgi:cytochrome P450